jgi:hypothetical protein
MWNLENGWLIRVRSPDRSGETLANLLALIVVEQYRLLHGMLQVIQEVNTHTGLPICNESTCPTMSAGRYVFNQTNFVKGRANYRKV